MLYHLFDIMQDARRKGMTVAIPSGKLSAAEMTGRNFYGDGRIHLPTADFNVHDKYSWDAKEALNINFLYLESMHALINQYIIAMFRGDMELVCNALTILADLMLPKMDTTTEIAALNKIEDDLAKAIGKDTDGNIVRYSPDRIRKCRQDLRREFAALLRKLESRGMLTYVAADSRKVLGNFGSS